MAHLCERCIEKGRARGGEYREHHDAMLCDSCETTLSEAAHERMLSDYYGGESPQSIHEQYDAAAKQKRSER